MTSRGPPARGPHFGNRCNTVFPMITRAVLRSSPQSVCWCLLQAPRAHIHEHMRARVGAELPDWEKNNILFQSQIMVRETLSSQEFSPETSCFLPAII